MSLRRWWRRRRWAKRRKKAAEAGQHEPLREFVYLDDVSVYSLLASRIGALATEFTESESTSLSSEVKATGGVTTPVAKSQVSSSVKSTANSGAQVMRKATVQSTFRELYGYIRPTLVLEVGQPGDPPPIRNGADLRAQADRGSPWVLHTRQLERGQLLEIEVALDADDTFRAVTVLSTLLGFLRDMPQLPGSVDRAAFADAVTGMRLIDGLLDGVVPVKGKALHFEHITVDGDEFVVHRRVADALPVEAVRRPLVVVGTCEAELFWRDLRRVLFSGSRYRMLCRVSADGISQQWRAIKLADVLEGVVPGLEGVLERIPGMLERAGDGASDDGPDGTLRAALDLYALDLARHYGRDIARENLIRLGLPGDLTVVAAANPLKQRRGAFDAVTARLEAAYDFTADPMVATRLRTAALLDSDVINLDDPDDEAPPTPSTRQQRYLEAEIVAVYW